MSPTAKKNHYVAIMAGGIGSRFWPKSKVSYPKQFLDILGLGRTLIQMTYDRFAKFIPPENIFVVTNADYVKIVKKQLPELADSQILGEPVRKNTAPCVAYISNKIHKLNPDAVMIVAPSDHLVLNTDAYIDISKKAIDFASKSDALVTLGIVPSRPDTGYGYIQFEEESKNDIVYRVKTFTEKPTLEIAKKFLKSGDFLWNAGIFIWKVNAILKEFRTYQPDIADAFETQSDIYNSDKEKRFMKKAYELSPSISIDYGIMEKSENVYVIPSEFGWSDLGTWQSLYDRYEKDYLGNAVSGRNVMIFDSSNNMIMVPDEKLVVLQGLENYIVVDTGESLLVCQRDKEQEIKQMTAEIKKLKGEQYL
jgi:mannose-1-phosphate guanylyltransferase